MTSTSVMFPVTAPDSVQGAEIRVQRCEPLDGRPRNVRSPGTNDHAARIVEACREIEPDTAVKLEGIVVSVKRIPTAPVGYSYGLAVAIADKILRLGCPPVLMGREVWATGEILTGTSGEIAAVEQFDRKLRFVLEQSTTSRTAFCYCAKQQEVVDAARRSDPNLFADSDCILIPLNQIADLFPLKASQAPDTPSPRAKAKPGTVARNFVIGVGGVAIFSALLFTLGRPIVSNVRCERSAEAVAVHPEDSLSLRAAIDRCTAAERISPRLGRNAFLVGQLHSLAGDAAAARESWERAGRLGYIDGTVAAAFSHWLDTPSDRVVTLQTISALEKASLQGSVDAPKLLSIILMDGRAMPPDPKQAEYWLSRSADAPE